MTVYAKTRKRKLIDLLHDNGVSISYDRVLEISSQLGEAVITKYIEEGVVCPPVLRKGIFTTSAIDNIDHNPSAITANTAFHGTSISIFQHPSIDNHGQERQPIYVNENRVRKVPELPESFTSVPPAYVMNKKPNPPATIIPNLPEVSMFKNNLTQEYEWLDKVMLTENVDAQMSISWSAHHAKQRRNQPFEVSISSLLPLLRDSAHSVATIKHCMNKIGETVRFLNPEQIPVIAADQPLFALAKQIQWQWPERYGEDKFVIMFGGLHIEMAALKSLGTVLKESGWISVLVDAGVASPGTAESFLSATRITKTRQAHQITACALYKLVNAAYDDYVSDTSETHEDPISFEQWCDKQKGESPQFMFWYHILNLELTTFILIRSFREANFNMYREALSELIPNFFANDNVHYSR